MSREAIAACRTSLELIAAVSTEATVHTIVSRALQSLDQLAEAEAAERAKEAGRKRLKRAERPRMSADIPRTSADMAALPSIVSGSSLLDAWLDGMRQVAGASWIRRSLPLGAVRTLEALLETTAPKDGTGCAWAQQSAKDYVAAHPGRSWSTFAYQTWEQSGRPAPYAKDAKAPEVDPAERQRAARKLNREADAKVVAAAAELAKKSPPGAADRDRDQDKRARVASTRPASVPTSLGGEKAPKREYSAEELAERKRIQLEALAALEAEETKKAQGT